MTKNSPKKAAIFAPKAILHDSRKTGSLRLSVIIGLMASFAVAILAIWVLFFQTDNNIAIELNSISATKEGRLELQGLTYKGKTQSGAPYRFSAQKAAEDANNANLVHLTTIDGEITNPENGQITLSSQKGQFDQLANFVTLQGDVLITQSARQLQFRTQMVSGDLTNGNFEAPGDVDLKSPSSHITAEAMTVTEFGDRIVFTGQSKAIIGEEDES